MSLSILFVDDEPTMIKMYSNLIKWEEYDFIFAGFARDGEEALEILCQQHIDVAITDLRMPVMSGIELIRKATENNVNTHFIVVSGYDEFALVKEAFKLGVTDYFIKQELVADELIKALLHIKEKIGNVVKIDEQSVKKVEIKDFVIDKNRYRVIENVCKEIIWGNNEKYSRTLFEEYGMSFSSTKMCLMALDIRGYSNFEETAYLGERELLKYAIFNIFDEFVQDECMFCYNIPGEYVFVFSEVNSIKKHNILELFNNLKEALLKFFSLECVGGLSSIKSGYENLKSLYKEAKVAKNVNFFRFNQGLVFYGTFNICSFSLKTQSMVLEFKRILEGGEVDKFREGLMKFKYNQSDICPENIDDINFLYYGYYMEILNFLKKNEADEENTSILNEGYLKAKDEQNVFSLNRWFEKSIDLIMILSSNDKIIYIAKKYIQTNYKNQITLEQMAFDLDVSTRTLSRIFNRMPEKSFKQYLLKVRIAKAIELLKNSNMKVYNIAEDVGFSSVEHFSRTFKKITGKTPRDFLN